MMNKDHFVIEICNELSTLLEKQYKQLKKECFVWEKKLTPKQLIEHNDKFCSRKDKFLYVFATQNGLVIGQVALLKRDILYKGKSVILGGIGGLCVTEKKRKMGIASALLKKAMQELKTVKCDVAYLCTDIKNKGLIKLYSKKGFVPLNKPHTYLGESGKRYIDDDGMIAPVCSLEIFKQILNDKEPFDIGVGNW